ncbi:potassium-transporting ATPase subunit KdpC [Schumannella luteola]|uniref:Potassium-transporting ATPase KdpC subunit n=1 Tax=Schumannella luteola TaxID=472059 RepID=A0A852YEJ6_9MICO|nr:potassium-transporting ATPase subunit KdpC [Schumannella luteola]NYH00183.1 K+-transporting ATPase ATPase C chain [Schumannella luteola]TPX04064.1 potassium-transporting ATPase subunit KdpC [Schumannella luteola]
MNTSSRTTARTLGVAVRAMVVFTLLLGVAYTAVVTGIAQLLLPAPANGSLLRSADGSLTGSSLIGQSFTTKKGEPLAQWFQSRPSAAGETGYDAGASSGSNLGPNSADLEKAVRERRAQVAAFNHVDTADVPVDAVTASGSGLDPHISPAYALLQVERVAAARDLPAATVRALVEKHIQGPDLGFLGQSTVNVLELNSALAELTR